MKIRYLYFALLNFILAPQVISACLGSCCRKVSRSVAQRKMEKYCLANNPKELSKRIRSHPGFPGGKMLQEDGEYLFFKVISKKPFYQYKDACKILMETASLNPQKLIRVLLIKQDEIGIENILKIYSIGCECFSSLVSPNGFFHRHLLKQSYTSVQDVYEKILTHVIEKVIASITCTFIYQSPEDLFKILEEVPHQEIPYNPHYDAKEDISCAICYESLWNNNESCNEYTHISILDCGHCYHTLCLLNWVPNIPYPGRQAMLVSPRPKRILNCPQCKTITICLKAGILFSRSSPVKPTCSGNMECAKNDDSDGACSEQSLHSNDLDTELAQLSNELLRLRILSDRERNNLDR